MNSNCDASKDTETDGKDLTTEVVSATVSFEYSPSSKLNQDIINNLGDFMRSKEHLQRNICTVSFGSFKSWNLGNMNFKHEIPIYIRVKTNRLWESGRNYLRKHLGSS